MAVVICLNRFLAPVDDTVTAQLQTQVTSHNSTDEEEDAVAVKAAEQVEGVAPHQGEEEPKADSIPDDRGPNMGAERPGDGYSTSTPPPPPPKHPTSLEMEQATWWYPPMHRLPESQTDPSPQDIRVKISKSSRALIKPPGTGVNITFILVLSQLARLSLAT